MIASCSSARGARSIPGSTPGPLWEQKSMAFVSRLSEAHLQLPCARGESNVTSTVIIRHTRKLLD